MRFYNREKELKALNKWWREPKSHLIIVYGKRRVGKTALCLEFARGKPGFYYLAERLDPKLQLKKLSQEIGRFFKDDYTAQYGIEDWEQLFAYIAKQKQKIVLIIDEFPYLVEADPGVPSLFQKGWDLHLSESGSYLILCGSSIGMMEEHTLIYRAPLYGRRSGQILVEPFTFRDLKTVFPERSFSERLLIYSIVGGTITYLKHFLDNKNIWRVVKENILAKEQFLYEEVEFLLREELREPRNYFSILLAMSQGERKLGEIINATGFDKSTLSSYLSILNNLRLTEKEVPITEKYPEKSRKGLYRIADPFVEFWFRFVFNEKRLLETGQPDKALKKIKQAIDELMGRHYEVFAREYLKYHPPVPLQFIGKWWDRNQEIDVLGINEETRDIVFAECKWSNKPVGTNIYEDLKAKTVLVDWHNDERKEHFVLFSKAGFTEDMKKRAKKEKMILVEKDKEIKK